MQLKDRVPIQSGSPASMPDGVQVGIKTSGSAASSFVMNVNQAKVISERNESDSALLVVSSKMETISTNRNGAKQENSAIKEQKLVSDFKLMQNEMRAMISNTKSPEKVPLKLKQHGFGDHTRRQPFAHLDYSGATHEPLTPSLSTKDALFQ